MMLKLFLLNYCQKYQNISSLRFYTSLLKHQNICHKTKADWTAYRRERNFVTNLINCTKRTFFKDNLKESKKDPNKFWKLIKSVFPVKHSPTISSKSFLVDGETITDKKSIADRFFHQCCIKTENGYFSTDTFCLEFSSFYKLFTWLWFWTSFWNRSVEIPEKLKTEMCHWNR